MPKTKEQIKRYNKEYFARPEVIARAKVRNAERKDKRKEYKKTEVGRAAENKYRRNAYQRVNRNERLIKLYGISIDHYDKMLADQNGVCAICCVRKETRLHVDHCHKTNKVRGILCSNCNMALGLMKDRPDYLLKAVKYLNVQSDNCS